MAEGGLQAALDQLLADVADCGDVVAEALARARTNESEPAGWVSDIEARSDALVEDGVMLLTRERPFATDLRVILAVIRSSAHLRRSGSLVGHLQGLFARLEETTVPATVAEALEEMHTTVVAHYRYAVAAFRSGELEWAADVETTEARVDALAVAVADDGAAAWAGTHDEAAVRAIMACGLLGRFLERLGDHATALGREISYIHTASDPPA